MMPARKKNDSQRLDEIREKIRDEQYIEGAIQRLAQVLSYKIIEIKEFSNGRQH